MNDIVQRQTPQVPSDPAAVQDYYAKAAAEYAEQERRAGSSISVKNGVMTVGDQPITGNQFAAVILDSVRLNTYYKGAYNPNNIVPPTCYAIGREEQHLQPHPDMAKAPHFFQPQNNQCAGCPLNEYGSRGDGSQGKACTNRRRLLLIPAGMYGMTPRGLQLQPFTDTEHYRTAPLISLALSPTMLAGWGQFVRDTMANYQRPPFGVITRVYLYNHPKHGKEAVGFEMLYPNPPEWDSIIIERHQEAAREIFQGYEPPQQQQQQGGGFYQAQKQYTDPNQGQQPTQVQYQQPGQPMYQTPPQGGQ